MDCNWSGLVVENDVKSKFENMLPQDNKYEINFFKVLPKPKKKGDTNAAPDTCNSAQLNCHFKLDTDINDKKLAHQWLEEFSSITKTSWNRGNWHKDTDDVNAARIIFSARRKCIQNVHKTVNPKTHQMRADQTKGKNQDCPSWLTMKIRKPKDGVDLSMSVEMVFQHSHPLDAGTALRYHPVAEATKQKFLDLFSSGCTASSAYHTHRANLRQEYPDTYVRVLGDRSLSPDFPWVNNFHSQFMLEKYGTIDGPDALKRAMDHADKFNAEHPAEDGKKMVVVHQRPDGHVIIAICNELERRVHEVSINIYLLGISIYIYKKTF